MATSISTGLVSIDEHGRDTRLEPHRLDLKKLHEHLPGVLWPRIEATPLEMGKNNRLFLYPGRVLVGHAGGVDVETTTFTSAAGSPVLKQPIWAYLWQVNCRGDCSLDLYIGDTRKQVAIGNGKFWERASFEQWCLLLANTYCPAGSEGGWESKVKNVVKIAMLERGYYDGTVAISSSVFNAIRQNQPTYSLDLEPGTSASATSVDDQQASAIESDRSQEHAYISSYDEDLEGATSLDALQPVGHNDSFASNSKRTRDTSTSKVQVDTLREAFPADIWPRVDACHTDPSRFYTGKVHLGKYRITASQKSPLSLWARVTRKSLHRERFGHVICTDDLGKIVNLRLTQKEDLNKKIELDASFKLIDDGDQGPDAMTFWRASMAICVRVALVDKGFIDGADLVSGRRLATPPLLAAIVKQNLEKMSETRAATVGSLMGVDQMDQDAVSGAEGSHSRVLPSTTFDAPSHAKTARQSLGLGSEHRPLLKQATSMVPAKRSHGFSQGAEEDRSTASVSTEGIPSKKHVGEPKRKSSISPALFDRMKNAVSPKPGSPAHKEAAALKESVAALQADVAHLKDQVASRDARIDIQNTENSKLVAEASKQAELLKTVRNRNAALVVERINVADENKGLKASIAELQAKTDSLNAFKQTHLREGQPMLVELMTLENRVDNKMDEQAARRAAKLRYVATYGIPVEDSDDGEHFTWED